MKALNAVQVFLLWSYYTHYGEKLHTHLVYEEMAEMNNLFMK